MKYYFIVIMVMALGVTAYALGDKPCPVAEPCPAEKVCPAPKVCKVCPKPKVCPELPKPVGEICLDDKCYYLIAK